MTATTLETRVHDVLTQKRIAVAGVSRNHSHHPVGNLIYQRSKRTRHDVFPVNPLMQTFEGARCYPDLTSSSGGVDGVVIGPFELTEYLGLAMVWGALAVTAPFGAVARPVPATR